MTESLEFDQDLTTVSLEQPSISIENMLYPIYYKTFGIRRNNQLMNPVFHDLTEATLPKNAVYHYNPESPTLLGPLENNPWYKTDNHLRFVNHNWEYKEPLLGGITRKPGNVQQYMQAYRRKHRTLRLLRDWFGIAKQENMLIVENYCLLDKLWKYKPHLLVNYFKFHNLYHTILTTIDERCDKSERHQFFEIRLPKRIEPKALLRAQSKMFEKGYSKRLLKIFSDDDSLLMFHFWVWLGRSRHLSLFNKIKSKNYDKVNFIFTDNGRFTILNLGQLDKWRVSTGDAIDYEIDADDEFDEDLAASEDNDKGDPPEMIQAKFYRFLLQFVSLRSGSAPAITQIVEPQYTKDDFEAKDDEDDDDEIVEQARTYSPDLKGKEEKKPEAEPLDVNIDEHESDQNKAKVNLKKDEPQSTRPKLKGLPGQDFEPIDPDEDVPEQVEQTMPVNFDELSEDDTYTTASPAKIENPQTDYALQDAKELVQAGQLTAKEYTKFKEKLETFKTLPNPFDDGKETVESYMKVDPKVINDIEPIEVPDNPWILDKSMLTSTTENFDKQYVSKVMKRNLTQSVMSLQKAGIAVTDMKVKRTEDPMNKYDVMSLKVQPLGGKETTINIKLPVFEEDGTFMIAGTKYFMKKLRVDKVIRKVNPTTVSLSTYYGKLFVKKADRKTFNQRDYLIQQIQENVLSENPTITDVQFGNVFDNSLKLPTLYSNLASRFAHFKYLRKDGSEWTFYLDYKKRYQMFGALELIERQENKLDGTLVATTLGNDQKQLFIKPDNSLVIVNKSDDSVIETLPVDKFFGFTKPLPLEMVEFRNMGKSAPLGIILGYYVGLTQLLRMLNITPRKVYRGQRLNLEPFEFPIKFADEVWVFDRRNYQAQLILAGFVQYQRYLEDYSVHQYEDKDVYATILRDAGFTGYFEEELELLRRMFIDDISRDNLLAMNEPTEYVPLLIRAVELLTDLTSRTEINMEDMMITGYQRIAGQVYKQLVKAVKDNRRTSSLSRGRFDFKENSVFRAIQTDSSVAIVDDINPIHSLKEKELVTFTGDGGRSTRTLVGKNRAYDPTDLGTISEASVDNSNVGATTYLSASPNLRSLYGQTERADLSHVSPASLLSTTSMLSVGATTDDQRLIYLV